MLVGSLVLVAAPVQAAVTPPAQARFMGQSLDGWGRDWAQWVLGDASNPLIAGLDGDCGDLVDGVFFMTAPIALDVELDCDVPVGTAIVVSHAGFFTFPTAGETDEQLEQGAADGFTTASNELTLDGGNLPLITTHTGAFDVMSEAGGFYDAVVGLGTGPIRTAVTANITVMRPLAPGSYTLEGAVEFTNGEAYSVTYTIQVG
jgi:hypothetical protein